MYVTRVPNRGSPPAVLLRESYREGDKVKTRTLANLTRWPEPKVEALSRVLKGLPPRVDLAEAFQITRSLQHGHVAAVLGTSARLGIAELIDPVGSRNRDLVLAMLTAQVIARRPRSWKSRAGCALRPRPAHWVRCWAWAVPTRTTCMRPWTGCSSVRRPSKTGWPQDI